MLTLTVAARIAAAGLWSAAGQRTRVFCARAALPVDFAHGRECHILVGMNRRALLKSAVSAAGLSAAGRQVAHAAIPKMKITRVRVYSPERANPLFNQSDLVVTIETDAGITGIGEGGARDTLEQSAGRLIGQDPQYIERLWQDMTRCVLLSSGAREDRRHRRARSGAVGHQREGAGPSGACAAGRDGAEPSASATRRAE